MSTAYRQTDPPARADDAPSPLKTGRDLTGLTQEAMAATLGTDPRTLRRWEADPEKTPDEIMLTVARLADCPQLLYTHFKSKYRIADEIMPSLEDMALSQAVIGLLNALAILEQEHIATRLLALAADGMIDYQEEADYAYIMAKLDGLIQAVTNLKFCQKRRADNGTGENADG